MLIDVHFLPAATFVAAVLLVFAVAAVFERSHSLTRELADMLAVPSAGEFDEKVPAMTEGSDCSGYPFVKL